MGDGGDELISLVISAGVMRHADAGYDIARDCAKQQGLDLPML